MPRPGPRPYECVRRSWHSDRHQPMRGSIIQQIFRVVNESHSAGTKKNREWQQKLPVVVLKSEEIMYSKANSEAEYMDPETLWDRVNDAINTIIRKDESMETGDLLPPCVEAALTLGCVPVRASRSQRNSTPRSYLSPGAQDSGSMPPKITDRANNARNFNLPNVDRTNIERLNAMNETHSVPEANKYERLNYKNIPSASCNHPSSCEKPSPGSKQVVSLESESSLDFGEVYPLYYGVHFQPGVPQMGFQTPQISNTIIVGTPVFQAISEPSQKGCLKNPYSCDQNGITSNTIVQSDLRDHQQKEVESVDCDLSLRLGLISEPCLSRGKGSARGYDDIGPSNFQEAGKFRHISPLQSKEFSFFPVATANEPLDFCTSGWNFEGEGQDVEASVRKRKLHL